MNYQSAPSLCEMSGALKITKIAISRGYRRSGC